MREFTPEEKERIVNTPITFDSFEMVDSFSDYDDLGLYELGALYSDWEGLIKTLEELRLMYIKTKDERYFIELVRLLPNSYKAELKKENAELKEKYSVYTDGKTPDHSFIYKEFPKENLENLPHIKELYTGTKKECLLFKENLFLKYNLSKAKEIIKDLLDFGTYSEDDEQGEKKVREDVWKQAEQFISEQEL